MIGTQEDQGEFQQLGCPPGIAIAETEHGRGVAEEAEAQSEAGNSKSCSIFYGTYQKMCV